MVMLYFLPETPKFLISKGKYDKARLVFQKIFAYNSGESMYLYPVSMKSVTYFLLNVK